jgi:hypothetical protein
VLPGPRIWRPQRGRRRQGISSAVRDCVRPGPDIDWPDVQFGKRPTLKVRRQYYRGRLSQLKSRNGQRQLPLSAHLARQLWTARPASGKGPVFRTRTGSRYLDGNIRRDVLDPAAAAAKLEGITFHTFRHTCASVLFESGKNIRQVAAWLGHADPAFTLRTYVHLLDRGLGEQLGAPWGNAGATQDPTTADNAEALVVAKTAITSENHHQPQAPDEAALHS